MNKSIAHESQIPTGTIQTDNRPTSTDWCFTDVGEDGDAFELKVVIHGPGMTWLGIFINGTDEPFMWLDAVRARQLAGLLLDVSDVADAANALSVQR